MKTVKIREALGVGWNLFMQRPWYLLGLTLATCGLFVAVSSKGVLVEALGSIIYAGYIARMLAYSRGESIQFDDLFDIDKRWIYFAFLMVIKSFFILLGFICFVVPGIYLTVRWMFAEILVIDQGMRPLEALRASSALTAGNRGKLFLYSLTALLLIIVGFLFIIIGGIIGMIVTMFATLHIYKELQKAQHA